jgi:NDP-sugar pyrophosphorylase family protein
MVKEEREGMNEMQAVILAGGKGTRLLPYTAVLPKPLMPVGDMPILEIVIRQLCHCGIRRITISVGYLASLIQAYFGDGEKWDVEIDYSQEETPLGTAGPLRLVEGLKSTFLVMNGDLLTTVDYAEMARFHREQAAIATIGLFRKRLKIDLGVIETTAETRIARYLEKPTLDYLVSMGIYIMEPAVLDYIPQNRPFDLPDLITTLIQEQVPLSGYFFSGQWLDIGRYEDYAQAAEIFESQRDLFLPGC